VRNVVVTGGPRARARAAREDAARTAFRDGDLGLDRYGLRAVLAQPGVQYLDYQAYRERP
jgi:4-hydroxy-4-methyl-2-oxoglutarate aldolase